MKLRVRRFRRSVFLAGLAAVALVLGGCVYLRLLQLKLQLGDFEKNFAVATDDGLALTFNHPVLLDEDVEKFFHWVPDSRQRIGTAEKWHFAWVKNAASAGRDESPTEIAFDLYFNHRKLVKIVAPERFFAATMPKSLALAAVRSLGHAKVDQKKRTADSTIGSAELQNAATDRFLSEDGLLDALGKPTSIVTHDETVEWRYEFAPISSRQRFGDGGVVDVTFTLDAVTRKVRLMKGRTVFGSIVFDTTHVGAGATGNMRAALPE
jgi:hypothetical protein